MCRCHRNADEDEKVDEMGIVDFISGYLVGEIGSNYSAEVVRRIMEHITEVVVEKYEEQKKLPLS